MRAIIILGLCSIFVVGGFAAPALKTRTEKANRDTEIAGLWQMVSVSQGGDVARRLEEPHLLHFDTDGKLYRFDDKGKRIEGGSYLMDIHKNPPTVDLVWDKDPASPPATMKGIYRIDDNKMIVAVGFPMSEERPSEIASAEGLPTLLLEFERYVWKE